MSDQLPRFSQYRPHPWHGLPAGPDPPRVVTAYIEITPFDLVKYEVDKTSGYLRLDRPQMTSSLPPALYGFIPQTYCGRRVGGLSAHASEGDEDPMDICVVTGRPIGRSDMIVTARVIGVLRADDRGRADDKIIGVMETDPVWGGASDLEDLPEALTEPLVHYFTSYKGSPREKNPMEVRGFEGRERAWQLVEASMADYSELLR